MALTKIEFGSLADPEIVNNNFEYLDEKITETSSKIYNNNTSLESMINSQVSTLTNSLNNMTKTLSAEIETVEKSVESTNNSLNNVTSYLIPNYTKGISVDVTVEFTAPNAGIYVATIGHNQGQAYLKINGIDTAFRSHDSADGLSTNSFTVPLDKGDKAVWVGVLTTITSVFYPYKGQG